MWKCGTFILLTLNILLLIAFYIINNGYHYCPVKVDK